MGDNMKNKITLAVDAFMMTFFRFLVRSFAITAIIAIILKGAGVIEI